MKEKREQKMKDKIKGSGEHEERSRRKEVTYYFVSKKCSRTLSNAPDELAQNVSKKSLSDELFLHFLRKFRI